ncbi:MAG: hypothetical protein KJ706_07380, partial [Candidatus Omnitrophica bacterium]|nr:hypothetical protein [Candidatus Omnitrophota bacterium]
MSIAKMLLIDLLNPKAYLWIDATLIKETPKAILIEFDGKKIWLPKAWIVKRKLSKHNNTAKIKISEQL